MKYLNYIALTIAIIGCINWGCIGLFNLNLVSFLFGDSLISRIVYILVGLSGLYACSFFPYIKYKDM